MASKKNSNKDKENKGNNFQTGTKTKHKATYARDKKNIGHYLIRVEGPHASKFEGRVVPVLLKNGEMQEETLDTPVWAGIDDKTKKPICLYKFVAKPKEEAEDDEFEF